MTTVLEVLLLNTAFATAIGVAARTARALGHPQLAHALWIVALVKLVTPPVLAVDVVRWLPAPAAAAVPAAARSGPYGPATAAVPPAATHHATAAVPDAPAARRAGAEHAAALPAAAARDLAELALLAGAALAAGWTAWRTLRFRGRLRATRPAPAELVRLAERLAPRLGLRSVPRLRLWDGRCPPFLWVLGRDATLVLPAELAARLPRPELATLIAHELAHYRRGDHHVRYLEAVVRVVHFWNPVVWWALRELRRAEEECCDALVLAAMPAAARRYADALVATAELVAAGDIPMPGLASGVGRFESLRRRLSMILSDRPRRAPKRLATWTVALLAAAVLPWGPATAQEPGPEPGPEANAELERLSAEIAARTAELDRLQRALVGLRRERDPEAGAGERARTAPRGPSTEATRVRNDRGPRALELAIERFHATGDHEHAAALRAVLEDYLRAREDRDVAMVEARRERAHAESLLAEREQMREEMTALAERVGLTARDGVERSDHLQHRLAETTAVLDALRAENEALRVAQQRARQEHGDRTDAEHTRVDRLEEAVRRLHIELKQMRDALDASPRKAEPGRGGAR